VIGPVALVLSTVGALAAFLLGTPGLDGEKVAPSLGDDGVLRNLAGAGVHLGLVAVLGVALDVLIRSSAGAIAAPVGILLILRRMWLLMPVAGSLTLPTAVVAVILMPGLGARGGAGPAAAPSRGRPQVTGVRAPVSQDRHRHSAEPWHGPTPAVPPAVDRTQAEEARRAGRRPRASGPYSHCWPAAAGSRRRGRRTYASNDVITCLIRV
jgi:hypothetical protein